MSGFFIPKTYKAWLVVRRGKPSTALELKTDVEVPKLSKGEVLVKVQAAALNPVGHKMMGFLPNFLARRPLVAEHDFAGVVVDANGSKWQNGQDVYGSIMFLLQLKSHQGALGEYLKIPAARLALRPPSMNPTEASGLGLAGLTAYQGLFNDGKIKPGQHIFINGGSTAVGIFAIQIAKTLGCTVTASGSGRNEEFIKNLGVDKFIDYTKGPIHEQLAKDPPSPKFDIFLEAVGLKDILMYTRSEAYIAPGGSFISVGPMPGGDVGYFRYFVNVLRPRWLGGTQAAWKMITVDHIDKDWEAFAKLVTEGKVKGAVDSVHAFEDVLKAYERIMTSRATGKVVVKVDPSVE